jgi:hypothetical protein
MLVPEPIEFEAKISFKGSPADFEKVAASLQKLKATAKVNIELDQTRGLMIETVPLPESAIKEITFETVIKHVPFPGYPPPEWFGKDLFERLGKDMPRLKINKDIWGGMRNPHFHIGNEIVLLDQGRFKQFIGEVAAKISAGMKK